MRSVMLPLIRSSSAPEAVRGLLCASGSSRPLKRDWQARAAPIATVRPEERDAAPRPKRKSASQVEPADFLSVRARLLRSNSSPSSRSSPVPTMTMRRESTAVTIVEKRIPRRVSGSGRPCARLLVRKTLMGRHVVAIIPRATVALPVGRVGSNPIKSSSTSAPICPAEIPKVTTITMTMSPRPLDIASISPLKRMIVTKMHNTAVTIPLIMLYKGSDAE
mmetsp:Transcript_21143/g.42148  ORF Transcript_21143/g.42148 Transcript_21143/m.42148 type:complete len:220 (+) Transcript_21143:539-1198(+)